MTATPGPTNLVRQAPVLPDVGMAVRITRRNGQVLDLAEIIDKRGGAYHRTAASL